MILDNIIDLDMKGMTTVSKNKMLEYFKKLGSECEIIPCQAKTRNWIEINSNSKDILWILPRKTYYAIQWIFPKNKLNCLEQY